MKKATLIIWVIIFGFIALVIFQNQTFFLSKQTLRINLGVFEEYHSPELPIAILVLIFFFVGLLIAYLFSFSARFKAKRTIKKLNATITSQNGELSELKRELNTLKGIETPEEDQADTVKIDMDETQKIADAGDADKTEEYALDSEVSNPSENKEEKTDEKIQ
ncbi:MAG: LapA family protein [Desulfobacterales bacterium]|nr:MAG: LapA family protein [Desulfobacterales bacterium]